MLLNKRVVGVSLIGTLAAFALFNSREVGLCSIYCGSAIDKYQNIFLIFPLVLFFSLVTMFMKEAVFDAWWKFARFAIPVVLIISVILSLELHHTPGGWFNMDNEVDLAITALTYMVFILGSAIQMYRGYRKS